jgi:hypothetical protein
MMRKCSRVLFLLLVVMVPVLPLCAGSAHAGDADSVPNPTPVAIISIPGLASFDISWVDEPTQTYYFADRTHAAVQIIDARTNEVVNQAIGFVGFRGSNDVSGPDGVVVIQSAHELWAGDGDSTVKVFDLKNESTPLVATHVIDTGGRFRADEMAFDPKDHLMADRLPLRYRTVGMGPGNPEVLFVDSRMHRHRWRHCRDRSLDAQGHDALGRSL